MKTHKLFYDTEFCEGFTKPLFGQPQHFIDLISIGMVDEHGREYYAINKEVDLRQAWYAHTMKANRHFPLGPAVTEDYWVRDNVLMPIFYGYYKPLLSNLHGDPSFTLQNMQKVINALGKTKQQINLDIRGFVYSLALDRENLDPSDYQITRWLTQNQLELVGYYSAYDHVLLASLFGRMVDWPTGFPMYTTDLQQRVADLDKMAANDLLFIGSANCNFILMVIHREYALRPGHIGLTERVYSVAALAGGHHPESRLPGAIIRCRVSDNIMAWDNKMPLSSHRNYPKQVNEHNALADAKWNRELDRFLATH